MGIVTRDQDARTNDSKCVLDANAWDYAVNYAAVSAARTDLGLSADMAGPHTSMSIMDDREGSELGRKAGQNHYGDKSTNHRWHHRLRPQHQQHRRARPPSIMAYGRASL